MNKPITPQEFLALMARLPKRPDAECDRLLMEIRQEGSPVRSWLIGMEAWARANLPTVKRSAAPQVLPEGEPANAARGAGPRWPRGEKPVISPILKDYLRWQRGNASADVVDRVATALGNPASELSRALDGMCVSQRNS